MKKRRTNHAGWRQEAKRRGFTLVEVLVVVGLVVVLATILIVALSATTEHAAATRTRALLTSLNQATSQFKRDHGYLPPILDAERAFLGPPPANDFANLQEWYSITSPAEYLIGYGGAAVDGKNAAGIRSPGTDGVWGATGTNGLLVDRQPDSSGKVYGPYLQLEDSDLLASLDPNTGNVFLPSDAGFDDDDPRVIVDFFGEPIRYYRDHPDRNVSLGDVFLLRPFQIEDVQAQGAADARNDTNTTFALKSAGYAFFSPGPDRTANQDLRFDDPSDPNNNDGTTFSNEDNLVETGR